ncbi:HalOD1 output domain-containing protein [Haladaptatus halobius]|uniref:HalOD1 output domain-containing protein n=1 Tax=Haladaptatus halobius TaxID=2884875 RepID=UPI001D0A113D|nr:HalOD1 output domain-containing protein [Haladaptatus halobius]
MSSNQPSAIAADQDESSEQASSCTEQLSLRVTHAVADAAGSSSDELEPLYHAIDPEALDSLFAPTYSETSRSEGLVQFVYAEYEVIIHSTGEVTVTPVNKS